MKWFIAFMDAKNEQHVFGPYPTQTHAIGSLRKLGNKAEYRGFDVEFRLDDALPGITINGDEWFEVVELTSPDSLLVVWNGIVSDS